jgi:DeoR/GlpR family transcriptional regulator of sugar metabolism
VSPTLRYTRAGARRDALVQLVRDHGFCSVRDLSDLLGVSRVTVRRDILQLHADGLVRAAHGGVSAVSGTTTGGPFELRRQQNQVAKQAIAQRAAKLLAGADDVVIGIDAGTTAAELADCLASETGLTIVTHSLPVMNAFSRNRGIELVAAGGVFDTDTQAFTGPAAIANLQRVRLSTLFLTASSIRSSMMYCGNDFEAEAKRTLLSLADRVVLLIDSSKFARAAAFTVAPLEAVDLVVVDDRLSSDAEADLADTDIELVKVAVNPATSA